MEHVHGEEYTRKICNRLSRAIGHLEAVKRMVAEDRDCSEVLIQLAAVNSALNSTSREILSNHLKHCIAEAIKEGDDQALEELERAIERMMK